MKIYLNDTSRMEWTSPDGTFRSYPITDMEVQFDAQPMWANEAARAAGHDPIYKSETKILVTVKTPEGPVKYGEAFLHTFSAKLLVDTKDADYVFQFTKNGDIEKTTTRGL